MAAYSRSREEVMGMPLATLFALRAARSLALGGSLSGMGYRTRDIVALASRLRRAAGEPGAQRPAPSTPNPEPRT
ncbi:MAG: hypothetical protein IT577_23715 [Verrucomicrobiae bacterium]|nr:hypothetical protein [Verrucomicrobiae bacterium]